ncbi:MAG: hypothetical protein R3F11_22135 [Verrucomicrobiales bacterium]
MRRLHPGLRIDRHCREAVGIERLLQRLGVARFRRRRQRRLRLRRQRLTQRIERIRHPVRQQEGGLRIGDIDDRQGIGGGGKCRAEGGSERGDVGEGLCLHAESLAESGGAGQANWAG